MRPAALLTGLTGVVAVMVLVYVGLTALNLEPHITFGDPNRLVASADAGEAAKLPVVPAAPPAPAAPIVVAPTPPAVASAPVAPPLEKPAAPVSQTPATAPAAVTPPQASASTITSATDATAPVQPSATADVVPSTAVASTSATSPTAPEPSSIPTSNPASEAATALANALSSTAPAPPALPVKPPLQEAARTPTASEAKPSTAPANPADTETPSSAPSISPLAAPSAVASDTEVEAKPLVIPPIPTSRPVEEAAKSDLPKHDELSPVAPATPGLPTIPTPLARPEPPPLEEAKASPNPAPMPAEPTPAVKALPPVEEASLPPSEATPPKQPETPAGAETAAIEPNADLKPVDLSRPLAERAGVLTIGNKVVQLAGILPTDPARSCTGPNGKEWPCGTLARTALRAFLLGRTITCDVPDPQWKGPVTAECRFARVSLSDWLARNGWAEPAAGSPLMAAADEARKSGLGIYGNDPRKKHISTLAPTPPPEDPLNPI